MNTLKLAFQYIKQNKATALLGILLAAFGSAILCILMLTSNQLENQLDQNSRGIDLVVGAKGSPTQLILSSIYHVDNPTGNITMRDAQLLANNPYVRMAVPLALGDNFKGHRIVGTDSTFLELYQLEVGEGRLWEADYEAVIGAEVARIQGLKIGDRFVGAHGLSEDGHIHGEHPFVVTGVLKSSGKLVDRLILSNVSSVWAIHGLHQEDAEDHDHTEAVHEHDEHEDHAEDTAHTEDEEEVVYVKSMVDMGAPEKEITAMLIQYSNPAAIGMLPRMVNQSTSMQAASPALESARLFSLLGMGIDSLQSLAYIIMFMAAFSVFISLYNAFKSRKYDLAIMRTLGASRGKLFGIVIAEGILITLFGAVLGIVFGHLTMYLIALQAGNAGSLISAFEFQQEEAWLFVVGIAVGFLAAVIPAVKAYNTSISETLADSNA
jgi:putative ABC transport system permease protein